AELQILDFMIRYAPSGNKSICHGFNEGGLIRGKSEQIVQDGLRGSRLGHVENACGKETAFFGIFRAPMQKCCIWYYGDLLPVDARRGLIGDEIDYGILVFRS